MNKRKRVFFILALLSVFMFVFATTAYARDIGSWTKNIDEYSSWYGTVTHTKFHSSEGAVFNVTHPNAYIWVHGTNSGAIVFMDFYKAADGSWIGGAALVADNTRRISSCMYPYTGETYLGISNPNGYMVDTKGTWSPDAT